MLSEEKINMLDRRIAELLAGEGIVGCSVALTDRDGLLYSRGFGLRVVEDKGTYSTPESVYRAASVTKVVTGMLAMRLAEEGRLELDAPVIGYLPWLTLKDESAARTMTLRHLLTHRSGLPTEYTPEGPLDEGMLLPSLKEGLPTLELIGAPSEKYLYSNWGIRLLSAALEAVMGERYSSLAERYILSPIGMKDSAFVQRPDMLPRLSMPHEKDEKGAPVSQKRIKENHCRLATGGLYSTATDLSRLARVILRGGTADSGERIIERSSLEEMMREVTHHKSGNGYGIAMQLHPIEGTSTVLYGHCGSANPYATAMFADPESGFAATVLLNTYSENLRYNICDLMIKIAADL